MSIDPDGLSPAEQQLVALLELLQAERLEPGEALPDAVMGTVEWQVLVRSTIVLIGDLVGSMAAMLALFLSDSSREPRDEA
jgi:uncharacterized protein with NRDE domain